MATGHILKALGRAGSRISTKAKKRAQLATGATIAGTAPAIQISDALKKKQEKPGPAGTKKKAKKKSRMQKVREAQEKARKDLDASTARTNRRKRAARKKQGISMDKLF